jgi:hypothetical protein
MASWKSPQGNLLVIPAPQLATAAFSLGDGNQQPRTRYSGAGLICFPALPNGFSSINGRLLPEDPAASITRYSTTFAMRFAALVGAVPYGKIEWYEGCTYGNHGAIDRRIGRSSGMNSEGM